jgi:hypothetical protein
VPLGTDAVPGGLVPLGTDGVEPGRVPLGTDAVGDGDADAAKGAVTAGELTGESAVAGVVNFESLGTKTSTPKVNDRSSPGCSAPTFTTCRATSSPFSFLIETSTEYSQAWPTLG